MLKGILALLLGTTCAILIGVAAGFMVAGLVVALPVALILCCLPRRAPKRD